MIIVVTQDQFDELDRNARAYGFEIGRGKSLMQKVDTSDDNPFLDPTWRDKAKKSTS